MEWGTCLSEDAVLFNARDGAPREEPFLEDTLLSIHPAFDEEIQGGRVGHWRPFLIPRGLESISSVWRWGGAKPPPKGLWVGQGLMGMEEELLGRSPMSVFCLFFFSSVCCLNGGSVWVLPGVRLSSLLVVVRGPPVLAWEEPG